VLGRVCFLAGWLPGQKD